MINKCHYEQKKYYTVLVVCPLNPHITKQQRVSIDYVFFFLVYLVMSCSFKHSMLMDGDAGSGHYRVSTRLNQAA